MKNLVVSPFFDNRFSAQETEFIFVEKTVEEEVTPCDLQRKLPKLHVEREREGVRV